jgi:hypothetical protein
MISLQITGKKGKIVRNPGDASILIDGTEKFTGSLGIGIPKFIIKDNDDRVILHAIEDPSDCFIYKDDILLARISFILGFWGIKPQLKFDDIVYYLKRKKVHEVGDGFKFSFKWPHILNITIEDDHNDLNFYRGIGIGYYIWIKQVVD